jgi:hypothetical protein
MTPSLLINQLVCDKRTGVCSVRLDCSFELLCMGALRLDLLRPTQTALDAARRLAAKLEIYASGLSGYRTVGAPS